MDNTLISEFEDLLKLKSFQHEYSIRSEMSQPFWSTYYSISDAIINEYSEEVKNKLFRWCDVTRYLYFHNVESVKYYFQSKMLYRDGFYESVIVMVRSICEMICYQILEADESDFYTEQNYNRFIIRIAMFPKKISKEIYKKNYNQLIKKIYVKENEKVMKLNSKQIVKAVINNFKKEEFEDIMNILNRNGFFIYNKLSYDSYNRLNCIYSKANTYVHKSDNTIKKNNLQSDAKKLLIDIGEVLNQVYGVESIVEGTSIISGYCDFGDICKGMRFGIDYYKTLEAANLAYYNLPSKEQFDKFCSLKGKWNVTWKEHNSLRNGEFVFSINGNDGYVNIIYRLKQGEINNSMDIKLYDDKIVLREFDEKTGKYIEEKHSAFKLHIFNENTLLGKTLKGEDVIATRLS